MEPIVSKEEVVKLIPQRQPIMMVDQLMSYSEEEAVSKFYISEDNILVNNQGFFSESGLIENIAQTTAMHQGYDYYLKKEPAPEGYIGSIRKLKIEELPKSKNTITTKVTVINKILGITIVKGEVYYNDKVIAECEMRLVESRGDNKPINE